MDQGKHKHGRGKILHVERDFDTIEKRNRGTYLKNMKHLYIEMQIPEGGACPEGSGVQFPTTGHALDNAARMDPSQVLTDENKAIKRTHGCLIRLSPPVRCSA